jgi:putative addiction module killer protein
MKSRSKPLVTPPDIIKTLELDRWLVSLRDNRARGRILARIRRLSLGNFGDTKSLGGGIGELRVDYGPGYRIYYAQRGDRVLLTNGGDKSRKKSDIARAREIAAAWEPEDGT